MQKRVKLWGQPNRSVLLALVLACGTCGACNSGKSPEKLLPVEGTITWKGVALEGANIEFIPQDTTPGAGASGRTDAAGRYSLQYTRGGRGTPAGTYKVIISCRYGPDGKPQNDQGMGEVDSNAREILPNKYSDREHTILRADIQPDKDNLVTSFSLK